jgi:hypothetical protein
MVHKTVNFICSVPEEKWRSVKRRYGQKSRRLRRRFASNASGATSFLFDPNFVQLPGANVIKFLRP